MIGISTATKLRIARVLRVGVGVWFRLRGRSMRDVACTRHGVRWALDLDEGVQMATYLGVYERSTRRALARLASPDAIIIDVGANIGAQALPAARRLGAKGRVIAVEPADAAMARLRVNAALNPELSDRLTLVHRALVAPDERPAAVYFASWPVVPVAGVHPVHHGVALASSAAGTTLDALTAELALDRVDVIKLDVDGNELPVLRGASRTLDRFRPAVVFELCPYLLEEHGEMPGALPQLFVERGYRLVDERTFRPMAGSVRDLLGRVPPGGSLNIVALPERSRPAR